MNVLSGFRDRFFHLAVVNILSNLMVPLAGLIDVAFLGHLAEIRHLAGVALATVLFNYIYWSFGFLRMGTTGTTAQAVGRGDRDGIVLTALRNGVLALLLGVIIVTLQVPLREIGFRLLSATAEVKASGIAYYNALVWGAPATLTNFVLVGWFLGRSQGSSVLLLSGISNGANALLNYWFIVRLGWESAGAGWGTALSQWLMVAVGIGLFLREVRWREIYALSAKIWDAAALKSAFVLNSDILVRTFALVSTFALFTNLSSALGTVVLATNTLLLQVITLAAYFIDGLAFATESFAGMFRGQGNSHQMKALVQLSGGISLALGIAFALTFILFPTPFFSLLTSHADILDRLPQYTFWLLPVLAFGSIAYLLDGYFLGLTEGAILRRSSIIAALCFVPGAIAAWWLKSPHVLWFALTCFMAGRAITLSAKVRSSLS